MHKKPGNGNDMNAQWADSYFHAGSASYLEEIYEQYLRDPSSVDEKWQNLFTTLPVVNGSATDTPHSDIQQFFKHFLSTQNQSQHAPHPDSSLSSISGINLEHERKQVKVLQLINHFRIRGHQNANLDPLELKPPAEIPDLSLRYHELSLSDLETVFNTGSLFGADEATLGDILEILHQTYCGSIGFEYMHIVESDEKRWLQQRIESARSTPGYSNEIKKSILKHLTAAEGLEKYLHTKYVGQKRFSLEGGESLIVMLNEIIQRSGSQGIKEAIIAMAHRGRLNVLVNIMGKIPSDLFQEFEGKHTLNDNASGDVKYHMGFSSDVLTPGGTTHLALAFNPSHLEIVGPVAEGSVRARQDRRNDKSGDQVVPIIVHGDAAFAGQGVVMETFNMSQSRGYSTKGTVHIVVNNQIGFTTSNQKDARSTLYCSDVAKMVNAPIIHVNGDDPEAVMFVTQVALDYRMTFKKDIVIDLFCYRRHGHNEADEPSATQPIMYQKIKRKQTTRKLYETQLIEEGVITAAEATQMIEAYRNKLDAGECVQEKITAMSDEEKQYVVDWSIYLNKDWEEPADTALSLENIRFLGDRLQALPEEFETNSRVRKIMEDRRKMTAGSLPIDWGYAETMAYASLVNNNIPVRLSGQDCGRGTFFHRHAVLHNQIDGSTYIPIRNISDSQANFLVIDSVLSEEAVLAFEYGYATASPGTLVIWEAQFGDFVNGAQVVIDQFISSGEQKWGRLCGLTLFLPHGYEGQGPEHSSARPERFLQLCAQHNMQVCMPTTPAQAFHMIRRQALRPWRAPLVVMTPKSLLRHKHAVSSLEDLSNGCFMPVLPEVEPLDDSKVNRVILCSGKIYFDLVDKRRDDSRDDVAIVRIEQLYPFPEVLLRVELERYTNAEDVYWCQEEPMNQGAWYSSQHHIRGILDSHQYLEYAGRPASASPAVGSSGLHAKQHRQLIEDAFK